MYIHIHRKGVYVILMASKKPVSTAYSYLSLYYVHCFNYLVITSLITLLLLFQYTNTFLYSLQILQDLLVLLLFINLLLIHLTLTFSGDVSFHPYLQRCLFIELRLLLGIVQTVFQVSFNIMKSFSCNPQCNKMFTAEHRFSH